MLSAISSNSGMGVVRAAIPVPAIKTLALSAFVLQIISMIPVAKAMDHYELMYCFKGCERHYPPGQDLEACKQRCYDIFLKTAS